MPERHESGSLASKHNLRGSTVSESSLIGRPRQPITTRRNNVMPVRIFNGRVHFSLVLLALVEISVVVAAVYLAILVRFSGLSSASAAITMFQSTVGSIWPRALLVALVTLPCLASMGLYQMAQRAAFTGIVLRLAIAVLLSEAMLGLIFYLAPSLFVGRGIVGLEGLFSLAGLTLVRYGFLRLADENIFRRRVLVWGSGARAANITSKLRRRNDQRGFNLVGFVKAPGDCDGVPGHQILPSDEDLLDLALRFDVAEIVVAPDDRRQGFPITELLECRIRGIEVCDILEFFERESGRLDLALVQPSWLIFSKGFRSDALRLASKRVFDVAVSTTVLVCAAPIALLTAIAIFLEDRGPALYRQTRVGQNGRLFQMFKFRSMRIDAEPNGEARWAVRNDSRITRIGKLIRKLRIDELPQVINVLLGHMSFVGPRPERPEFVENLAQAIPYYRERHCVKPGITGWAQVRFSYGSSEKDARQKLEYDLYYVKNHSLALDLMVLVQTVEIVVFGIGSR